MTRRYLAQAALTGEILAGDLPIKVEPGGLTWALSGPGSLLGTIAPEYAALAWSDGVPVLGEMSTYLYAEDDGRIVWGGILHKSGFVGGVWTLEAYGFSSYAAGMPYTGDFYTGVKVNPIRVFKDIWDHLQDQPDGDLGLAVVGGGGCTVDIGTKDEPYTLSWWEAPDCGDELDQLTAETPFDYVESHEWGQAQQAGGTDTEWVIRHRLEISFPRRGYRRDDLVFNAANLTQVVELNRDGTSFANVVHVLGKGEGKKTLRGESATRDGRLRRVYVHTDKLATTTARVNAVADRERGLRQIGFELAGVSVQDHPNAPVGSWQLGDDILVDVVVPHIGRVSAWYRVIGWSLDTDTTATLQLSRADSFRYAAAALPPSPVYAPGSTVLNERVATFNLHRSSADESGYAWSGRKAKAIAAMAAVGASLWGLQECTGTQRADIGAGYASTFKGNVGLMWLPSVWTKISDTDTYRLEKGSDDRWLVAATFLHLGTGRTLRVGCTHLTNLEPKGGGDGWRIGQLREILAYEPQLQILLGDFNDSSAVFKVALSGGQLGQSRHKATGAQTTPTLNSSHKFGGNTKANSRRIDEVLTRTDVAVFTGGVLNTDKTTVYADASDHNIVYANIGV